MERKESSRPKNSDGKVRHTWAWIYGTLLTAYTVFTLLQVFVIPHDTVKVDESQVASVYQTDDLKKAEIREQSTAGDAAENTAGMDDENPSGKRNPSSSDKNRTSSGKHRSSSDQNRTSSGGNRSASDDNRNSSGKNRSASDDNRDSSGKHRSSSDNDTTETEKAVEKEEEGSDISGQTTAGKGEDTYQDDYITINITSSYINDTMVYVADIRLKNLGLLKSGLADDSFGRNVTETTSDMADRLEAILAVNGDFYGFRDTGYVIRNGILYRSKKKSNDAQDLVLWSDGTMEVIREGSITAEELLEQGALQVYSFGPGLVEDGEIMVDASSEVGQAMLSNPRTAIGMIEPLHYVMVVSDGRTNESEGLSLLQLAEVMQDLGCTVAYNLDGGGSTTMYFNGEVINNPTSGRKSSSERSVSDIVYIGY